MKRAVVATLVVLLLATTARAQAAGSIRILNTPAVQDNFPESLVFTLDAQSDSEIRDVRLRYTFVPENTSSTAQADFTPGAQVHATFTLRSNTRQLYIPPGKTIRYSWELHDAAGNQLNTDDQETSFADSRFDWQQVTDGDVTLNYYQGNASDARVMAQVANETITKASALLNTTFNFPIKVWAYASQADFIPAIAHSSGITDPGVLGQAHEPDTFILVVDRLTSPTALDTVRHELTHLVTAHALQGGPFKDLYPIWLNEGTSVYMQVSPNDVGYIDALNQAIKSDSVVPLRALTDNGRAQNVGLFYGESYAVVKYLIGTYGADKFAQMMTVFKNSGDIDQTFKQVYGVDRDGLYRAWRQSVGLPPVAASTPAPPADSRVANNPGKDDHTAIILGVAGTVILVLLAAAAAVAGLLLARRNRHAA